MSESPDPGSQQPPGDEDDDWRFDFERPGLRKVGGGSPYDGERADAGEITDLGTGDDPPRSGE